MKDEREGDLEKNFPKETELAIKESYSKDIPSVDGETYISNMKRRNAVLKAKLIITEEKKENDNMEPGVRITMRKNKNPSLELVDEKKYELVEDDIIKFTASDDKGNTNCYQLYRIKALKDFDDVKKGDLGGYIDKESNLSQCGNCWVGYHARVYGNARVHGDARVDGEAYVYGHAEIADKAHIFGNARVYGSVDVYSNARIFDSARVYGYAQISGYAQIFDSARVYGDANILDGAEVYGYAKVGNAIIKSSDDIITFSNVGSEDGTLTAYRTKDGVRCDRGCFAGTLEEFEQAVKNTHGNNKYGIIYKAIIEVIKLKFSIKE